MSLQSATQDERLLALHFTKEQVEYINSRNIAGLVELILLCFPDFSIPDDLPSSTSDESRAQPAIGMILYTPIQFLRLVSLRDTIPEIRRILVCAGALFQANFTPSQTFTLLTTCREEVCYTLAAKSATLSALGLNHAAQVIEMSRFGREGVVAVAEHGRELVDAGWTLRMILTRAFFDGYHVLIAAAASVRAERVRKGSSLQ